MIGVDNNLPAEQWANHVHERLVCWYAERAAYYLAEKTAYRARRADVSPATVRVKDYKPRWGCCSVRGETFYNWKIIMAPTRVVDYVIIHELCYLHEANHSPAYWKHVEHFCPDFLESSQWLKIHGNTLVV